MTQPKNDDGFVVQEESGGYKCDGGKPRWELVPWMELEDCVRVITFGAAKYEDDNWKLVAKLRYLGALARHLAKYMCGEIYDKETGLPHMAHIQCNALFIQWKDRNGVS